MKRNPYLLNENDNEDIYGEEINYYIDTISNLEESIDNTEKSSDIINNINDYIPFSKDENKKFKKENIIYKKINSKDKYIKSLEQKIHQQEEQISKLIDYKNLCEDKIKEMNPLISLPLQIDNDSNIEKYLFNNRNKKDKNNYKTLNLSFNQNRINARKNKKEKIPFNRANSELDINNISNTGPDKYEKLYSKYIKIINDFKNLSNNSVSTNEYTRLKTQYNELKNKNNNLLKQLKNAKNQPNNNNEENEIIKSLKEQVKTFREQLVLSQAMVNSLRSEIEQYKKSGNDFENYKNDINNNNIQNSNYRNNLPDINDYKNNNALKEENKNLKTSLKNNNILLSKVLEENNKLRENNFGNENMNINQDKEDNQNNKDEIIYLKNNLIQYENKFDYFNDYIKNIKNKIEKLLTDINSQIYKFESPPKSQKFSENFVKKIKDLKKEIQKIKKIDRFNLDSSDDEECLDKYMNFVNLLLNELENNKAIVNIDSSENITFDKTKKYLIELIEILKEYINENGINQLITDALNILDNLRNLYKLRNNNSLNGYSNINEKILEEEKELDYIKKLLINHKKGRKSKQLTYSMNYNNDNIETNQNKNGYYFQYQ